MLSQRADITDLYPATDDPEDGVEYFGGPDYFADDGVFDPIDDATAQWALSDWLESAPNLGWDVHLELSKLLVKRGHLIRDKVEPIVRKLASGEPDEGEFILLLGRYQLCLSFLSRMEGGEEVAIALLDRVPEDFRDGLFHACFTMNTQRNLRSDEGTRPAVGGRRLVPCEHG
ncbi:MAG TPA: hypothetical protein VGI81_25375 [Tepidisphaeraceae bacterium]